jgi:hypothetical protein
MSNNSLEWIATEVLVQASHSQFLPYFYCLKSNFIMY